MSFQDFYTVPDLNFDISRLRTDLDKVLKRKKFKSPGVSHFGAISLNRVPNDKSSIEGNNVEENIGLLLMRQVKKFQGI